MAAADRRSRGHAARRRGLTLAVALGASGARGAAADPPTSTVTVTLTAAGQALAQGLGDSEASLIGKVHDKIDALYQLANLADLLHTLANASVAANRAVGVDFALPAGAIEIGVVGDAALAGGPELGNAHVPAGDLFSYGVIAGADLARWGVPRLAVFANAGYTAATIDSLAGHLITVAAHARVELVHPRGAWLGVAAVTGVEVSHAALGAAQGGITAHFTVQGNTPGESRNLTFQATGTLDIAATTTTVPLLVTTGVRAGGFSAYAGGGAALTGGGCTLAAGLSGDLSTTSDMQKVGALQITANGSDGPTTATVLGLVGMSVQGPHVNVFLQADISQTASAVTLGLRGTL